MAKCPTYLNDIVETVADSSSRSDLRSSTSNTYVTPRLRTKYGERAFSHAGPTAWYSLPVNIRAETSQVKFKKLLKLIFYSRFLRLTACFIFVIRRLRYFMSFKSLVFFQ